uniref:protein O-GlcNAc transferase n=1 Tax=viral metagenome TaxID=1070528 RepID=A0A6C0E0D0_9ZZZZ
MKHKHKKNQKTSSNNDSAVFKEAQAFTLASIQSSTSKDSIFYLLKAISSYEIILKDLPLTDYLLIDVDPKVSKSSYIDAQFNLGTLYKTYAEHLCRENKGHDEYLLPFNKALDCFKIILKVLFEHELAVKQIVSIYSQLCYLSQNVLTKSLEYMQTCLIFSPDNESIHYNLGLLYQKLNKLELALIHYRISLEFCERPKKKTQETTQDTTKEIHRLKINNYNGIASLYRSLKQWPDALYYLKCAEKVDQGDPDIQNALGVVYTEMRRTDLAEKAYKKGIDNYQKSVISNDKKQLLAELYLNFGHMHSYNGDNNKSIENYNMSLKVQPTFVLPFQNKIMNLSYLFDDLQDKSYIYTQHTLCNKLYKKSETPYKFDTEYYKSPKINVGIVSGDFADHPVQFFISTFLKNFNHEKFTVTCYSECIINTSAYNSNLQFKFIKNMPAQTAADMIYSDGIHILIDLAGHTAFNRLDIFALKPAPVQVSYIGYPYSTGLYEMDYRITDKICDKTEVSQKFYTEKLEYLNDCFLCYNPSSIQPLPEMQPYIENNSLTISCFNRLNKITDRVIKLFNNILLRYHNVKFLFKTKALLNSGVKIAFINKFDKSVQDRVLVMDCTITHDEHLRIYNRTDIAIDTFPYSGTTTSCEALLAGVPVFTLYDAEYYFHPQNVTSSILLNTHNDLKFFVCKTIDEICDKIGLLLSKDAGYWKNLKSDVRNKFLNGKVCDKDLYMRNINNLLEQLYNTANRK